jgi:hypothetical protein
MKAGAVFDLFNYTLFNNKSQNKQVNFYCFLPIQKYHLMKKAAMPLDNVSLFILSFCGVNK